MPAEMDRMKRRKMTTATSITASALKALDELSREEGRSNSSIVREAIYSHLRQHGKLFDAGVGEEEEEDDSEQGAE